MVAGIAARTGRASHLHHLRQDQSERRDMALADQRGEPVFQGRGRDAVGGSEGVRGAIAHILPSMSGNIVASSI